MMVDDARDVGLERDQHHVGHQAEVIGKLGGTPNGFSMPGSIIMPSFSARSTCCSISRTRGQIFVELAAIGAAQARLQALGVAPTWSRMLRRIARRRARPPDFEVIAAEQAFKQIARR